ncbi:hypothetical protein DS885_12930 [Psychromonas sp. B3M02]|uniref:DKNYY domain-containing protein n=1 Tax=Psychromonas sp. B3M02 TaxID=2267226 RepID=UPI000DE9DBD9|nr:DKNYY domain-containing protein [Psychromonas sp. B3M02]RBW43648.1 hypothetical protein DS885_12930 [Psychromonas sp. B3M02]
MKILMWIGLVLLVIFVLYALIVSVFSYYVSSPRTHNATVLNANLSNQYYLQEDKVIFVLDGNFFQIGGVDIEGADPNSFEVIDQSYAKDSNRLYYNGKPISDVTPDSIVNVTSTFGKNAKNSGYLISNGKVFCYGEVIQRADTDTFSFLVGLYAMDKNYLYYDTNIKIPREVEPTLVDHTNFQYLKHGDQIFYQGELISVLGSQFEIIDDQYSKDAVHVYSHGEIIKVMTPEGFTVISPYYRKDKNQAYYFNNPIPESDPNTFKVLNDTIAKDQHHLYYNGYIVDNKTAAEVNRSEANELAKRWKWRELHLSPTTVIVVPSDKVEDIAYEYFAYNNDVYSRTQKLEGVTADQVIVLDRDSKEFTRIGDQVFYFGSPIEGVDANTFELIADRFSQDAEHIYWGEHKVIDANPSNFEYDERLFADENEAGEFVLKTVEY